MDTNKLSKFDALIQDSRIKQAKRLIAEVFADYQKGIAHPGSIDPDRSINQVKAIANLEKLRGRPLYFPYLSSGIGKGSLVELLDGSVKYDMITGIGVHYMGHNHADILDASINAALEDTVMQGNLQQNDKATLVSQKLIQLATHNGANLEHCFLTSSGAMANENAFKVMFQKRTPAKRLLAFRHCFAGRTIAASQVTDNPAYRAGIPENIAVDYIDFYQSDCHAESILQSAQQLQAHIAAHKDDYAGMIFELVQGEGGFVPGNTEYFVELMQILKANQIPIMIDEVQTFGRNPEVFAYQYFGLDKYVDVVSIGKMSQICATLYAKEFNPKPGLLSQTFTSSTSAIYAAEVILTALESEGENGYRGGNGKIAMLSQAVYSGLEALVAKHPTIAFGPFGLGGMLAFEVFDASPKVTHAFCKYLFEQGVMTFVAGKERAKIRMLLPFGCITQEDIEQVLNIIESSLVAFERDVLKSLKEGQ
ncbi:MAG: 4-aminobutyrate aminotransferase-like enzyme [Candidatus Omnitrophota bacterium]|jgi:4-aminobutyrate aminotransferase-like enzyme